MAMERVAVYFDGFNLYHAIDDLGAPHLKWVDLAKLSRLLIQRQSQKIVKVSYFSAIAHYFQNTEYEHRIRRHVAYVNALKAKNVDVQLGNFAKRDMRFKGRGYRATWTRREEKQTDVAIAMAITLDAVADIYDRALIVSLDTDMLPVFRLLRVRYPGKTFITVAPPARAHHRDLLQAADGHAVIKRSQIEKALFGAKVTRNGQIVATRPTAYRPPP